MGVRDVKLGSGIYRVSIPTHTRKRKNYVDEHCAVCYVLSL